MIRASLVQPPVALPLECGRLPQRGAPLATLLGLLVGCGFAAQLPAEQPREAVLKKIEPAVWPAERRAAEQRAVSRHIESLRRSAIARENRAWDQVETLADWQAFRNPRIAALRDSLGAVWQQPPAGAPPRQFVTATHQGDGYAVDNLVFETRPGLCVTANLYRPAVAPDAAPLILFAHSHHNPKTQGELQDMGMTWARQGAYVLVMDQLGHGERRQHDFPIAAAFPASFRVSRQDYYFRYNESVQLQVAGESLMGWMTRDLCRGVDLLLAQPGADPRRVLLLGAVAGGGDPAGVAAALDERVSAVAAFNFGGPQPDYAIPENAREEFYFFGVPYWESTRCLRSGAAGGFAHWVIVASVAPRKLIYAHEFSWDRDRDPAWPRIERVFQLAGAPAHLGFATGRGTLKGRPPESTHCNNVGPVHRQGIYPYLEKWFQMPVPAEYSRRRDAGELQCLTDEASRLLKPRPLFALAAEAGEQQLAGLRRLLTGKSPDEVRKLLRERWQAVLGNVAPAQGDVSRRTREVDGLIVEQLTLEKADAGVPVPLIIVRPQGTQSRDVPVVVLVSRDGKDRLWAARRSEIAALLAKNIAVCLPDVSASGETAPGHARDRSSSQTTLSCRYLVLGETLLGQQVRDLRAVIRQLRADGYRKPALWAESLVTPNPAELPPAAPLGIDVPHRIGEPGAGLLALLTALLEPDAVAAIAVRRTLPSFFSLLQSPYYYAPHDVAVPGALTAGDVPDVARSLGIPVRFVEPIDGLNRAVRGDELRAWWPNLTLQGDVSVEGPVSFTAASAAGPGTAAWLVQQLAFPARPRGNAP